MSIGKCVAHEIGVHVHRRLLVPASIRILGTQIPWSSGTCKHVQGCPITCQPPPFPSIWIMESSRHSVHCLSTTSRFRS